MVSVGVYLGICQYQQHYYLCIYVQLIGFFFFFFLSPGKRSQEKSYRRHGSKNQRSYGKYEILQVLPCSNTWYSWYQPCQGVRAIISLKLISLILRRFIFLFPDSVFIWESRCSWRAGIIHKQVLRESTFPEMNSTATLKSPIKAITFLKSEVVFFPPKKCLHFCVTCRDNSEALDFEQFKMIQAAIADPIPTAVELFVSLSFAQLQYVIFFYLHQTFS